VLGRVADLMHYVCCYFDSNTPQHCTDKQFGCQQIEKETKQRKRLCGEHRSCGIDRLPGNEMRKFPPQKTIRNDGGFFSAQHTLALYI